MTCYEHLRLFAMKQNIEDYCKNHGMELVSQMDSPIHIYVKGDLIVKVEQKGSV